MTNSPPHERPDGPSPSDDRTGGPAPAPPPVPAGEEAPREYLAFCLLHQGRYLTYAGVRLRGRDEHEAVVNQALAALASAWPAALRSPCPAAIAWCTLGSHISSAVRSGTVGRHQDWLHRLLPPAQADAVILHRVMRLNVDEIGQLMGIDGATAAGHLRAAERNLPLGLTRSVSLPRTPL